MAYHLFQYPLPGPADLGDLNALLGSQRVVSVQQHLVPGPPGATLVFVVQTVDGALPVRPGAGRKIDYKEELSPEDFEVFSRLREERKKIAEEEGVPVYAVLTNEQLAEIARRKPTTPAALARIDGLGKARLEKHGARLLSHLTTGPQPPSPAS